MLELSQTIGRAAKAFIKLHHHWRQAIKNYTYIPGVWCGSCKPFSARPTLAIGFMDLVSKLVIKHVNDPANFKL